MVDVALSLFCGLAASIAVLLIYPVIPLIGICFAIFWGLYTVVVELLYSFCLIVYLFGLQISNTLYYALPSIF